MDDEARKWERIWRADPTNQEALRNAITALHRAGESVPENLRSALLLPKDMIERIRSEPEKDEPRLSFADWLLAVGDPRGEFIHAQCALAAYPSWPDRLELRSRQKRLLDKFGKAWARAVRAVQAEVQFTRGFVEKLETDIGTLLGERGLQAFEAEPIIELDLVAHGGGASVRALTRSPILGRIRGLKLRGAGLEDALAELLRSPLVAKLEKLNLGQCGVGAELAGVIAEAPSLGGLRKLALTGSPIGDEGVAALAGSKNLEKCEELFLARTEITEEGVQALAESPHLGRLRVLGLSGNDLDLDEETVDELRAKLKSLKRIEL